MIEAATSCLLVPLPRLYVWQHTEGIENLPLHRGTFLMASNHSVGANPVKPRSQHSAHEGDKAWAVRRSVRSSTT